VSQRDVVRLSANGKVSRKTVRQWNKTNLYGRCLGCSETTDLTRHHLVPKAMRGRDQRHECVKLCRPCHDVVHKVWGPGHKFTGATTKRRLVSDLRAVLERRSVKEAIA